MPLVLEKGKIRHTHKTLLVGLGVALLSKRAQSTTYTEEASVKISSTSTSTTLADKPTVIKLSEARNGNIPPSTSISANMEEWTRRIKYTDLYGQKTERMINENAAGARVYTAKSTGNVIHCAWCLLRQNYRSFREQAIVEVDRA
jgi:hypothetical protein